MDECILHRKCPIQQCILVLKVVENVCGTSHSCTAGCISRGHQVTKHRGGRRVDRHGIDVRGTIAVLHQS